MAYATLDELLDYMDLHDDNVNETLLQAKLTEAQAIIERVTERVFEASTDETRYVDYVPNETIDGRTLFLPDDLCRITSITNGDGTALTPDHYVTTPRMRTVLSGVVSLPNSPKAWPWYEILLKASSSKAWNYGDDTEEAIAIVGRWAFSETAPADIKQATILLADWLYNQKDTLNDREDSAVNEHGIALLMAGLPMGVQSRISRYVRVV